MDKQEKELSGKLKICSKCKIPKKHKDFQDKRNQCRTCRNEYNKPFTKKYYLKNKVKMLLSHRKYQNSTKGKTIAKVSRKKYYLKNKTKLILGNKNWMRLNKKKMNNWNNVLNRKRCNELSDHYVKRVLKLQGIPIKNQTQKLIEIKRNQLKLYRYVKQKKSATCSTAGNQR